VQGVAWDPLNEFVATQSSDRSVHIYNLKMKDGQFTLTPSLSLPAVKPLDISCTFGVRNADIYANETFTSFFRHLTFAPDGSLLFTAVGQYKSTQPSISDPTRMIDDMTNTVYIYTRAGFNKPPVAHLPLKKPSVAVKCSPIFYALRQAPKPTSHIILDTSSVGETFTPVVPTSNSAAVEPPSLSASSDSSNALNFPRVIENEGSNIAQGSSSAFALPYRIVYAVAIQDTVIISDTQQQTPLCVVRNLHFAAFTDLSW
jgi:chromatin assembly factor 1 subunit B